MKKALTLSIIIPTYNEADHIGDCLKSIANQSIMPDEVIVIDNNCIDDSIQIAKKYSFVRIVKEPKQGIVYARNKGFNEAKSDVLGRIDADSVLPPNWVETVKDFYNNKYHFKNYTWTSEGYWYNLHHNKYYSWFFSQIVYRFNKIILGHYPLWGSSMAITAKSWHEVKSKVCLRNDIHEDLDISIHLHRLGYEISYKTGIKTGTYVKRVLENPSEFWGHLYKWPMTLKVHDAKKWMLALIGSMFVYAIRPLLVAEQLIVSRLKNIFES